ncbi:MAG: isocitrate/isopropylmalate dehydrogenase family protein [Candidatus Thermoplasmatota archaeon]
MSLISAHIGQQKIYSNKTIIADMPKNRYKVVLLPGDGIGKEVIREGKKILEIVEERFNLNFEFIEIECGGEYYLKTGKEWEENSFEICKESDAILLGAVGWPGANLPNGDLAGAGVVFGCRFGLDLYANVRPTKLYPNVAHKISNNFKNVWEPKNVDFVIVRENSEGLYTPIRGSLKRFGIEEVAIDVRVITKKGAERVINYAYQLAKKRRKKLTCVDKSNVLRGCQFFRALFDEVGKKYQEVEKDYAYIDAFTQWMLRSPEWYDVVVTTNMFGDIITDLASVLQGGMGMAAGANIGDVYGMFEPIHGSAPKHANQDKANPTAMILATSMMLDWLGNKNIDEKLLSAGKAVEKAVENHMRDGKLLTYDLGGKAKCSEVGSAIANRIKSND